jgi:uncharacterized membrane protein
MRLGAAIALVIPLALAASCVEDTSIDPTEVYCPPDSTLTYANFGDSFISANCMSCHRSRTPKLTSHEAIVTSSAAIIDQAVTSSNMPDGASLTTQQRTELGYWLACGAP